MKDKEWGAIEIKIKEFERNQKFSEDAYFFHLLYKECTSLRAEVERLKKQSELQSDVMSERGIRIRQLEEAVDDCGEVAASCVDCLQAQAEARLEGDR